MRVAINDIALVHSPGVDVPEAMGLITHITSYVAGKMRIKVLGVSLHKQEPVAAWIKQGSKLWCMHPHTLDGERASSGIWVMSVHVNESKIEHAPDDYLGTFHTLACICGAGVLGG